MQVEFLPFIPKPVTEHATVYNAMINFVKLPCDEGVYRIVVEIYINCLEKFKALVPCLDGFYMWKCLEHCIGKYIKDALIEFKLIGKKTIEHVLNGTHHVRSLRGIIILSEVTEKLK